MAKESKQCVTITELSKQLNLSIATISSVLNNRYADRRISEKTVMRVQQAAREYRYLPNISARRLRTLGANNQLVTIAILTSLEAPLPLISSTMAAIQTVAQEPAFQNIKYSITVDMFQAGKLKHLHGLMDGSRFNAAIIANTIPQDDQFMTDHPIQTPIVFIGRNIPNYSSVREMADITGKKAADILVAAECRNLAILRANLMTQITQARLNGFLENALQLTGALPAEITANGFSEKDGYLAMRQFFTTDRKIDGLYVITDSLAVGAYHAIKEKGLKIPQDIAVIGTGDNTVAPFLDPPLSTFNRSLINLHEEAVRLLFRHISGQIIQPTQIVVPVVPVLRDSTRRGRNKNLSF